MRIGIVTQPLEMNYGGILQNWALQQVLKRLGHDPITIDGYERFTTPHFVFNYMRAKVLRAIGKQCKYPRRYHGATRSEITGRFIEKHIIKTHVMWDYKPSVVRRYRLDAIVVGSDQVWRYNFNRYRYEEMFLRFAAKTDLKKRVAYAVSFGKDIWGCPPERTAECVALAQKFDAISVREEGAIKLCQEHLGVHAVKVLDPTLLLDAEDYAEVIDKEWEADEPYLAVYCLDITPVKEAFFNQLAQEHGLKVRYFSFGWTATLTVEQWLAMFSNAAMVVTDSFHGTIFSIIFKKDFYSLCNQHRGTTRLTGMLEQLGLEQRLISDTEPEEPAQHDIDWDDVYARLDEQRKFSIDFLDRNLK